MNKIKRKETSLTSFCLVNMKNDLAKFFFRISQKCCKALVLVGWAIGEHFTST